MRYIAIPTAGMMTISWMIMTWRKGVVKYLGECTVGQGDCFPRFAVGCRQEDRSGEHSGSDCA